jgi:hypothetical protein
MASPESPAVSVEDFDKVGTQHTYRSEKPHAISTLVWFGGVHMYICTCRGMEILLPEMLFILIDSIRQGMILDSPACKCRACNANNQAKR